MAGVKGQMRWVVPGDARKSLPRKNILEVSHEREIGLPLDRKHNTNKQKNVPNSMKIKCYQATRFQGRCFVGSSRRAWKMRLWPDWVMPWMTSRGFQTLSWRQQGGTEDFKLGEGRNQICILERALLAALQSGSPRGRTHWEMVVKGR